MQKWFDKAAIAALALMLSAGLLVALPALGAYWQYRITEDAWKIIDAHMYREAVKVPVEEVASPRRGLRLLPGRTSLEINNVGPPESLRPKMPTQPRWGAMGFVNPVTQGSRATRQPWAKLLNRFAVQIVPT